MSYSIKIMRGWINAIQNNIVLIVIAVLPICALGIGCSNFLAKESNPPIITSTALATATEDQAYRYMVEATDPDTEDQLTFSLTAAPTGMTIDGTTGAIQWTPDNSRVGDHEVAVLVENMAGYSDTQSFTVKVVNVNDAPVITSTAIITATEDQPYSYDVDATDPDIGDQLTFSLDTSPTGMTINATTGVIQWTPTNAMVGNNAVAVLVTDTDGYTDTQRCTVTVVNVNDTPVITSTAVTTATEDQTYSYDVNATDPDIGDELTFSLEDAPTGMTINTTTGKIQWSPDDTMVGDHEITIGVTDIEGLSAAQEFTLTVDAVVDKYAIIIGISDYKSISDLNTPDEDANSWYDYLSSKGYLSWVYGDDTNDYPSYDEVATEFNVRSTIQHIVSNLADTTDQVVLVFSGHGGGDGDGNSYLCLWDTDDGELGKDGYYTDTELAADFHNSEAAQLFMFLDACYSGGMDEVLTSTNIDHVYMTSTSTEDGYGWGSAALDHGAWTYFFLVWGLEGSGHEDWDMATCWLNAYDAYHTYYDTYINPSVEDADWDGPDSYDHPMEFDTQSGTAFYL